MKTSLALASGLLLALGLLACDDKPKGDDGAKSAAASASAPPPAASSAAPAASASASASAAASSSAAPADSANAAPSKDAQVIVRDPAAQPQATAKVLADGAVTLYLPEIPGGGWTVTNADKSLGKAKEQTMPGFVGTTAGHQFVWQVKAPLKAGQSLKVQLVNKKKKPDPGDKDLNFTLTIDIK